MCHCRCCYNIQRTREIYFIGLNGVGKTSLIYKFLSDNQCEIKEQSENDKLLTSSTITNRCEISNESFTTSIPINSWIHHNVELNDEEYKIYDVNKWCELYIKWSNVIPSWRSGMNHFIFMYSIDDKSTLYDLVPIIKYLWTKLDKHATSNFRYILCGNKYDLSINQRQVSQKEAQEFAAKYAFDHFIETSINHKLSIQDLFQCITDQKYNKNDFSHIIKYYLYNNYDDGDNDMSKVFLFKFINYICYDFNTFMFNILCISTDILLFVMILLFCITNEDKQGQILIDYFILYAQFILIPMALITVTYLFWQCMVIQWQPRNHTVCCWIGACFLIIILICIVAPMLFGLFVITSYSIISFFLYRFVEIKFSLSNDKLLSKKEGIKRNYFWQSIFLFFRKCDSKYNKNLLVKMLNKSDIIAKDKKNKKTKKKNEYHAINTDTIRKPHGKFWRFFLFEIYVHCLSWRHVYSRFDKSIWWKWVRSGYHHDVCWTYYLRKGVGIFYFSVLVPIYLLSRIIYVLLPFIIIIINDKIMITMIIMLLVYVIMIIGIVTLFIFDIYPFHDILWRIGYDHKFRLTSNQWRRFMLNINNRYRHYFVEKTRDPLLTEIFGKDIKLIIQSYIDE